MKEILQEVEKNEIYDENEDIIEVWHPLDFKIDENYKYVPKSKIFNFFSNLLYYGVAIPILFFLTKIIYDLKIEGRENVQKVEGGAISVSNHVLILDCAMVGLALDEKRVYYTTREESFKIPSVRKLIKLLRAIPIPHEMKNKPYFKKALSDILKDNGFVHFYPEAALWPYYTKIRNFKSGAFYFAVENNVSILPMVFTFRRPNGFRRIFKKKSDVTLTILEPIKPEIQKDKKQEIEKLKENVYKAMQKVSLNKKGKIKNVG